MKRLLASLIVLGIATLACGISVRATEPEPPPATKEAMLEEYLGGRTIVIFGGDEFIANAREDIASFGANVVEATDLRSALKIAGDEPVEIHCAGETETVVQAQEASLIHWLPNCDQGGMILVGFQPDLNPDLVVSSPEEK